MPRVPLGKRRAARPLPLKMRVRICTGGCHYSPKARAAPAPTSTSTTTGASVLRPDNCAPAQIGVHGHAGGISPGRSYHAIGQTRLISLAAHVARIGFHVEEVGWAFETVDSRSSVASHRAACRQRAVQTVGLRSLYADLSSANVPDIAWEWVLPPRRLESSERDKHAPSVERIRLPRGVNLQSAAQRHRQPRSSGRNRCGARDATRVAVHARRRNVGRTRL